VLTHWLTPALLVAGFDGVHVDVEPYGNPSWVTDQRGTTTRLSGSTPWPMVRVVSLTPRSWPA